MKASVGKISLVSCYHGPNFSSIFLMFEANNYSCLLLIVKSTFQSSFVSFLSAFYYQHSHPFCFMRTG